MLLQQIRGKAGDVVQRSEVGEHLLEVCISVLIWSSHTDLNLCTRLLQAVLSPGDVLFIPRGAFHATSTESTSVPSLHLTVGMETDRYHLNTICNYDA